MDRQTATAESRGLLELLVDDFQVDRARAAAILERIPRLMPEALSGWLAEGIAPLKPLSAMRLVLLCALRDAPNREAVLKLVECRTAHKTFRRCLIWNYLRRPNLPLYARTELATLLADYLKFRGAHRDSLVQTGYPNISFGAAEWIDAHFYPLLPTRFPASAYKCSTNSHLGFLSGSRPLLPDDLLNAERDLRPRDEFGNFVHSYLWLGKCGESDAHYQTEGKSDLAPSYYRPCSYIEAPVIWPFPSEVINLVEGIRPRVLEGYLNLLALYSEQLQAPGTEPITVLAFRRLEEQLGRRDTSALVGVHIRKPLLDQLMSRLYGFYYPPSPTPSIPGPLALAVHCESELLTGAFQNAASGLGVLLRSATPPRPYFSHVGGEAQPLLDSIIDRFDHEYQAFTLHSLDRANVLRELMAKGDPKLRPLQSTAWVPTSDYIDYVTLLENLPAVAAHQRITTGRATPTPVDAALGHNSVLPQNYFRRNGGDYECSFEQKTCRMRNYSGMAEIAWLLSHPGPTFGYGELHHIQLAEAGASHLAWTPTADQLEFEALNQDVSCDQSLDPTALKNHTREVNEAANELAHARQLGNQEMISAAQQRADSLRKYAGMSLDRGGRPIDLNYKEARKLADKIRTRIQRSISHFQTVHPALCAHLKAQIHLGPTGCSYIQPTGTVWDTSIEL